MSDWTLTWLGHSGFRIKVGGRVLLLDPWLRGNPSFPEDRFDEAVDGATHILLSHAHSDHASSAVEIAGKTGAVVVAIYELANFLATEGAIGLNKGGTVDLGGVAATLVHAVHSSSMPVDGRPVYLGAEAGWMIEAGGETLYFMGDTDVFADMGLLAELHAPKWGIVPIGGHFTMDARRAAFACGKFFDFEAVIPCHYGTFPLLEQTAEGFAQAMAPTRVIAPKVMEAVTL
ncbi:metal-dependent hydrolase [Rubrimonas cliftonensis]|uniref:UPF0173 metal-dependent hydrolase SAMN05444370_102185 n=1 Tax=Rubrimonas cliftonensis TaxID=89524 RepID=A0A1H3WY65_9RHOB|nr:metal-dependent hydrolase [Rubrimonas cliftonensis]SDZ92053.1 L-ascorbate metabolism protein UlaG, beta-lactamase superfamily [Rubrimonas cliftonensis]